MKVEPKCATRIHAPEWYNNDVGDNEYATTRESDVYAFAFLCLEVLLFPPCLNSVLCVKHENFKYRYIPRSQLGTLEKGSTL